MRISSEAETRYITVATAVCVHIDACTPNFLIQEYIPDDEGVRREIVTEPIRFDNGYLLLPEKPGLGIELNEDTLIKYPFNPWDRKVAIREDGSIGLI